MRKSIALDNVVKDLQYAMLADDFSTASYAKSIIRSINAEFGTNYATNTLYFTIFLPARNAYTDEELAQIDKMLPLKDKYIEGNYDFRLPRKRIIRFKSRLC